MKNHGRSERHFVAVAAVGIVMLEGSQSWPLALLATEDVKWLEAGPRNFDFPN